MSAIYGIIGESDAAELACMGERLGHRGAATREWSPAPGIRFGVRAGTTRSVDSQFVTFDGVLDSAPRPADETTASPGAESGLHDAAIVESAYRQFGVDAFARLRGQFAVAVWDERHRRLVMARDRWGARSLYYARSRGRLLFASEYKAFLALADFPARHNPDALLFALRTHHVDPDACFLADARVVPRGSWLVLDGEAQECRRFWDIRIDIAPQSAEAHAQAVREALFDSVRRQLHGRQRAGIALSGGLDSATVLAAMRHVAPEIEVHTFTVGYGSNDPEIAGAARTARHFATRHHEIIVGPEALPAVLPETVWHMEDAAGGEELTYQFLAAREAARFVDIVFTGHKADVLFAGMPRHKLLKLAFTVPLASRGLEEFFHYTQRREEPQSALGRLLVKAYFGEESAPPVRVPGSHGMRPLRPLVYGLPEPLSQRLRADILEGSTNLGATYLLHAAHDLAWNTPYMDETVVRTAFEIPDRLKIRGLEQKHALRLAFRGLVPEFVIARRKSLQRLKRDRDLAGVLDALASRYLSRESVLARGIFDVADVEGARQRAANGLYTRTQVTTLWQLLLTEIWARLFLDARGRLGPPPLAAIEALNES